MEIDLSGFPGRLADAKGKMSNRQLAVALGISEGTVRNYLRGITQPPSDVLTQMVRLLGVEDAWLLRGQGSKFREGLPTEPPEYPNAHINHQSGGTIDMSRIEKIITAAGEALEETGLRMRPDKFAQFCTALYELELETGAAPSKAVVLRLVKSAA